MIVIQQPFGGRHHGASLLQLQRAVAVGRQQNRRVIIEPLAQRGDQRRALGDRLRRRQAFRMLFQAFHAK